MSSLQKALDSRNSRMRLTQSNAVAAIKASGVSVSDFMASGSTNPYAAVQDAARNRQKYSLYRGWVHSAINALANEGAAQPVCMARIVGRPSNQSRRTSPITQKMVQSAEQRAGSVKAAEQFLELIPTHPVLDILEHPNKIQGRWQFVYNFIANICLTGWGFVVAGETDNGFELYSIPTSWVRPDHSKGAFAEIRIVNPNNPESKASKPLSRDQFGFAYIPDPSDPMRAMSPAEAQLRAIKIDNNIQTSQDVFFDNGLFPATIITVGKNPHPEVSGGIRPRLTAAQRRQVFAAIRKVSGGVANYGNPAIVDGLIEKIERLSMTSTEMGWEKSEDKIRSRILSAFRVHPFILGQEIAGSYAQAYIVQDRFCNQVNVYLDMLTSMVQGFLPEFMGTSDDMLVWWEKCIAVDPSINNKLWMDARRNDDVSQDELRAYMGLPPDADRNESVISKQVAHAVVNVAQLIQDGKMLPDQGQAILEGMGLPTDLSARIVAGGPDGVPKPSDDGDDPAKRLVESLNKPIQINVSGIDDLADSLIESSSIG